jgi:hypothetical protein
MQFGAVSIVPVHDGTSSLEFASRNKQTQLIQPERLEGNRGSNRQMGRWFVVFSVFPFETVIGFLLACHLFSSCTQPHFIVRDKGKPSVSLGRKVMGPRRGSPDRRRAVKVKS